MLGFHDGLLVPLAVSPASRAPSQALQCAGPQPVDAGNLPRPRDVTRPAHAEQQQAVARPLLATVHRGQKTGELRRDLSAPWILATMAKPARALAAWDRRRAAHTRRSGGQWSRRHSCAATPLPELERGAVIARTSCSAPSAAGRTDGERTARRRRANVRKPLLARPIDELVEVRLWRPDEESVDLRAYQLAGDARVHSHERPVALVLDVPM